MPPQTRIFISYRRTDASAYAGRLYDALSSRFGDRQIFMDVDSLTPGANFVERIQRAVEGVHVLIAIIGPGWIDAEDEAGRRRLDDPEDFVALEVGTALARDVLVIPVLVGDAAMPPAEELPAALAGLRQRHALTLDDQYWRAGVQRLVETIEGSFGEARPDQARPDDYSPVPALVGAAMLTVGLFVEWDSGHSFVQNDYGGLASYGSFFSALAPVGLIVVAVLAAWLARRPAWRVPAAGALVGVGLAATLKYASVVWAAFSDDSVGLGARLGVLVALAGGVVVAASGTRWLRPSGVATGRPPMLPVLLGTGGAALFVAATFTPLNGGGPRLGEQVIAERSTREASEPIGLAIACAILAVLLLVPRARVPAAWALVAVGAVASLLWIRYIGVPLDQGDPVGSAAWGGFLGLAGSIAAVAAGLAALRPPRGEPRAVLAGPG